MTPIQRIDQKIDLLRRQYADLTRGCAVISPKARKTADRIARLLDERKEMIASERHSLGALLPHDEKQRNAIYLRLVKLPVIADFLYGACVDLQGTLREIGLNELTMMRRVTDIQTCAKELAFTLSEFPELENILSADDTLIGALDRKVNDFLTRKMNITK